MLLFHLILSILWAVYYNYPHVTQHITEAQRNEASCPQSRLWTYTACSRPSALPSWGLPPNWLSSLCFLILAIRTWGPAKSYTHPASQPTHPNHTFQSRGEEESETGSEVIKWDTSSFMGSKLSSGSRSAILISKIKISRTWCKGLTEEQLHSSERRVRTGQEKYWMR